MNKRLPATLSTMALALAVGSGARASSIIEALNLNGFEPSPIAGHVVANVIHQRFDARCPTVIFRVNNSRDPIPNPLGAPFLSVADVTPILAQAAQAWTDISSSYIEIQVEGSSSNPGTQRTDFVNEISFSTDPGSFVVFERGIFTRDIGRIAWVRRTVLLADATFNDGDRLDADADADVSAAISTCQDVDGDGDIEFPAGDYPAGTIIDADIQFATGATSSGTAPPGMRFTIDPAHIDDDPRSVDLLGVALQAFGLAVAVGHSNINQPSPRHATDSVLFPQIDTSDVKSEAAIRHLDFEAVSTASKHYPEGSASSGAAALQQGDVAFDDVFGIIAGEITRGNDDLPMIATMVHAVDVSSGRVFSSGESGESRWSTLPNGFGGMFLTPDWHIKSGKYEIVVPPGRYNVFVEAIDDHPTGHRMYGPQSIAAFELHVDRFNQEYWSGFRESALELTPERTGRVRVLAGERVEGVDIILDDVVDIQNYGTFDTIGFADAAPGSYFAVRIPIEQFAEVDAQLGGDAVVPAAWFLTAPAKSSKIARYREVMLTSGRVLPDGTARINLHNPIAQESFFTGEDMDETPFYFSNPKQVAKKIRRGIEQGRIESLFLVLRTAFSNGATSLIGLDGGVPGNDVPIHGLSYFSPTGHVFTPSTTHNFMFKLTLSRDPQP